MRTVAAKSQYQTIALASIHESANNPRRSFDESKLAELADSLRAQGLIQTIPLENMRTPGSSHRRAISDVPRPCAADQRLSISMALVAMLGLYAVMAYSVIGRHREFALRIALGSTRAAVFRLVLGGAGTSVVVL